MKKIWNEIKSRKVEILIEIFAIFLGLTAALILDDYKDKKKEKEFVEKVIIDIRSEYKSYVESNLEKEIATNFKFVDTLRFFGLNSFDKIKSIGIYDKAILKNIEVENQKQFSIVNILKLTNTNFNDSGVSNSSWELFSNQNLLNLDFELLKSLKNTQTAYEGIKFQTQRIVNNFSFNRPLRTYEILEFSAILSNQLSSKKQFIANIKSFLEKTKEFEKVK